MSMEVKHGYKQTEVGVIPDDWEVRQVRQKGEVVTGKALAVNGSGQQRPYLRTKNVFDGRIDIDDVLSMPMTDDQFAHFRLRHGDVLLNEGQSLELVGRCAIYQDEYPGPCAIQNQLLRFRAREGVCAFFSSYMFRYCQQTGVFARIALQTTSIAHLGGSRFERLRLAWPKAESEQRAIAEALGDVDALLDALTRLIAKKHDLKQAAMQQLLTGKQRLPGFAETWINVSLGNLGTWFSGGTPSMSIGRYWSGDIPWVSPKDMKVTRIHDTIDHVSASALGNGTRLVPQGAVLIVVRGMILAHSFPVARAERALAFNQDMRALVVKEGIDSDFVLWWLIANRDLMLSKSSESTHGTKRMPTEALRDTRISLPQIAEQTAIAGVLSDMDAEIAALEQRLAKTQVLKQGMMQELLTGRTRLV